MDKIFEKYSKQNGCSVDDCWREENALFARGSVGTPEEVAELVYFLADGGLVAK